MRKLSILLLLSICFAIEDGWDNSNFGISGTLTVSEIVADNFGENVLIVGTDTEFEYNNVDDAINAAVGGDVILVLPGTYTGFIDADVANITIISLSGPERTTLSLTMTNNIGIDLAAGGIVLD